MHVDPVDPTPAPVSGPEARRLIDVDQRAARRVVDGDPGAWEAFVIKYAGLILHVARRYVFAEDEARDVLADVLQSLREGKLSTYEGRSRLSTWLALVARNAALDSGRKQAGRRSVPQGVRELDRRDQVVFRLYFQDGRTFDATLHALEAEGVGLSRSELVDALARIDDAVTSRAMRRVLYNRAAHSTGEMSGRLLEYVDYARAEDADRGRTDNPEALLIRREARERARRVLLTLQTLSPEEQRILRLRFQEGRSARQIAEHEGHGNQRRVFTVLERIRRQLRSRFGGEGVRRVD